MSDNKNSLKNFMDDHTRTKLGKQPTWHINCMLAGAKYNKDGEVISYGPARPGKTARDRSRREDRR